MADVTPSLDEFRRAYAADDNEWWRLECGHHMNLFDEAIGALDAARARVAELEAERDASRGAAGRAYGEAAALRTRVTELGVRVAARDERIAELEADHARLVEDVASTVRRFSATLDERDALRARVAELEAQQPAPVAYTVIHRLPDGELAFTNRYYLDRTRADQRAADDGAAYSVVELREVSDRGE